jgi:hypothetical protein
MPLVVTILVVSPVPQKHRCVGLRRRHLAKIVGDRISGGGTIEKKAAPAEIARGGVCHGEGEGRRDGRVYRVPAIDQYLDADLRSDELCSRHHPVLDANGMRAGAGGGREAQRESD